MRRSPTASPAVLMTMSFLAAGIAGLARSDATVYLPEGVNASSVLCVPCKPDPFLRRAYSHSQPLRLKKNLYM